MMLLTNPREKFEEIYRIYEMSFPEVERRTKEGQRAIFENPLLRVWTAEREGRTAAFLTGWNLDASEIFVGKGGVTISWADTSALFAGPPEPQKPGFHVYDSTQLAFSVLDSVQRTVQCAFSPENPDSLNLWFCAADGSALKLDNLGVTLPLDQPYSHTLLENLLSQ